jgi:hypothetical protein
MANLNARNTKNSIWLFAMLAVLFSVSALCGSYRVASSAATQRGETAGGSLIVDPVVSQPSFLENTMWPEGFQITFINYPIGASVSFPNNALYYHFPIAKAGEKTNGKMKSVYAPCPNIPCVPAGFLNFPCEFYLGRDPHNQNKYMAYVFSLALKQYAVIAEDFGPMHPDFIARYYQVNPKPPLPEPPSGTSFAVGNPTKNGQPVPVQWFFVTGAGGKAENEDLFGVIDKSIEGPPPQKKSYRAPYSFYGKHMQLVYDYQHWVMTPYFPDGFFEPPSGYQLVQPADSSCPLTAPFSQADQPQKTHTQVMVCTACHISELSVKK